MLPLHECIQPFFQPIICVDKQEIYAYEVLGRRISEGAVHSLGTFFHDPLVSDEEKVMVDREVRFKALRCLQKISQEGILFINIQPRWLLPYIDDMNAAPTLKHIEKYNLNGGQVVIEISEDDFGEDTQFLYSLIEHYRQAGCMIAVDDFGEGFSSLERILLLKPDFLKISAGLFERSQQRSIGSYVMESLALLCEKTGSNLVLEEVETMEQYLMGLDAGVRYFQGYYFALPAAEFKSPDFCRHQAEHGLEVYLEKKIQMQTRQYQFIRRMNAYMNEAWDEESINSFYTNRDDYLCRLVHAAPGYWLRVYACDHRGYQITPNYTKKDNREWVRENDYYGRNWCWRPYFLPKVIEARQTERGTMSAPYLDLEYRRKIWTFIFPLQGNTFLFVDCEYI